MDIILFNVEFSILEERFNRKFSDELRDRYYEVLSAELDDEQFKAACLEVFKSDEFFPSPRRIIEAAPSLERLLSAEMNRLGLNAVLPDEFQKPDKWTVGSLNDREKREYLCYLKRIKGADEIRALPEGANDCTSN